MRNLMLAVGFFAASFVITVTCQWKKRARTEMTFFELYDNNNTDLRVLLKG